jgi:isopenicillin N synthase-like dioxygenase
MLRLAEKLVAIYAAALALPEDYFADKIDRHHSTLGVSNYPSQPDPPLPGQQRCAAHSDFSMQTIVHQDDAPGGLQIQGSDGEWVDVPRRAGALVVNLGDTMAWWTNHRWRSPVHRVINPPAEVAGSSRRQSLLFFHAPNYDATLACVPTCEGVTNSPEPPPLTVGELIMRKNLKTARAGA